MLRVTNDKYNMRITECASEVRTTIEREGERFIGLFEQKFGIVIDLGIKEHAGSSTIYKIAAIFIQNVRKLSVQVTYYNFEDLNRPEMLNIYSMLVDCNPIGRTLKQEVVDRESNLPCKNARDVLDLLKVIFPQGLPIPFAARRSITIGVVTQKKVEFITETEKNGVFNISDVNEGHPGGQEKFIAIKKAAEGLSTPRTQCENEFGVIPE